jgi:arginyl-tRNA synthetase
MLVETNGNASTARGGKRAGIEPVQNYTSFPTASDLAPIAFDFERPVAVRYLNCTSNKPLHLGHLRNIVLGDAMAGTLRALGTHAVRHCIGEDTGRFMTEAMVAIAEADAAGTVFPPPGAKSDQSVGACYARYREARARVETDPPAGKPTSSASIDYPAGNDPPNEMMGALLRQDPSACALRDRVKRLALAGQQATLQRLGVAFDHCDFESAEDGGIADFVARAEDMGLLKTGEDGARFWTSSSGERLRLVNKSGQFEESARLLSFNARVAKSAAAAFGTIVFAGSEWKASMELYAEFLAAYGVNQTGPYLPTFYGMVMLGGKKMASSTGTGVLVDDLVDEVANDCRLREMSRCLGQQASNENLAVLVIRAFLLSVARTDKVDFTPDRLMDPAINPGWQIASAWSRRASQKAISRPNPDRHLLEDAAARRSFEKAMREAHLLAGQILNDRDDEHIFARFAGLVDSLSLFARTTQFTFDSAPSLLSAIWPTALEAA